MRRGFVAAAIAYASWGLLPIYFKLLGHVDPVEIVTQRILWSLLLVLSILALRGALPSLAAALRDRRLLLPLAASAILIGLNWLTYIIAVNSGHVLAASLGYFLNPLVVVALGVLVLKEKLRHTQIIAIGIAAAGVLILAVSALTTLWISLGLALTFAFYGLVRKVTPVAPMTGLGVETLLLTPPAIAYLAWEASHGLVSFGQDAPTTALLILSGAVTTVPLVLFAVGARLLPMTTLGLLQYFAPTLQFLSGVLLFGERLSTAQLMSFGLIWIGLLLSAVDGVATARQNRRAARG